MLQLPEIKDQRSDIYAGDHSETESESTKMFGAEYVNIKLIGDTFDDCAIAAKKFTEENGMIFIPPFDDYRIIEGQGTTAIEILEDQPEIDFLLVPVGGWWLKCRHRFLFQNVFAKNKNSRR